MALLLTASFAAGCAGAQGPQVESSAGQVSYAKTMPARMGAQASRYESDIQRSNDILDSYIGDYLEELSEPDWELVGQIYEKAEAEGRSRAYFDHRLEAQAVFRFYEDERKKLVSRIAGAGARKAKEKGCEVELYGTTDWSLKKVILERLVERRQESSDAHLLILREESALGKKNVSVLAKQAGEIMFVSHMAHVGAPSQSESLKELLDEEVKVERALSDRLKEIEAEEKPDEKEREELKAAMLALPLARDLAEAQLKESEQSQKELAEKYDSVLRDLKSRVKKRAVDLPEVEDSE